MAGSINEIRVTRPPEQDTRGKGIFKEAQRSIGVPGLTGVRTTDVYVIEGATPHDVVLLGSRLFAEPVAGEEFTIDQPPPDGAHIVQVAYKPGVMNPEVGSILQAAGDLGILLPAADSRIEYEFQGEVSPSNIGKVVDKLLVNKTVQEVVDHPPETLIISGETGPTPIVPIRNSSVEELRAISKEALFLDDSEMTTIQNYFRKVGREPTLLELEIIAGRESEHCGHKTFNSVVDLDGVGKPPFIRRIKDTARKYFHGNIEVVTAFEDNSGGIEFYDGQAFVAKVETHNSPSGLEPRGGAMTGSGGVFRDIAGTGKVARTIASTDMFVLGPPDTNPSAIPKGTLHPDYTQRKVVQGVQEYGNRMGIPTLNGSFHYHPDSIPKPTVIVGAYGMIPIERAQKGKAEVGDLVVVIGGRTGRDGIHGATFSSGEMNADTISVHSSAVQIGNAIEEKKTFDALLEAGELDLIRAITDCGAAGFSSAVGEMGEDVGVIADVSKVKLKYPGLAAWEIWMSESQERMLAAISPENIGGFLKVCEKYGAEATVFGEFNGSNRMTVTYGDGVVADLSYDFLKNGFSGRRVEAHYEKPELDSAIPEMPTDWNETIKAVMSHGNVCSKEPVARLYDQGVQGGNTLASHTGVNLDGPNDAAVMTPILGKPYGAVISHGLNPVLNKIDPYRGSIWAAAEAMANYVAVGGDPDQCALINNYIWPKPTRKTLGTLDRSVDAVVDFMNAVERPVISGKDSLSSTFRNEDGTITEIAPVLCMSVFGRIPDVEKTVTTDIKEAGSYLYLVGKTDSGMGGSTYYDINGLLGDEVPKVDLEVLPVTLRAVSHAIQTGEVLSCHDVSEGGIIGAISEMAFGGDCGVELELDPSVERPDMFLFNETAGTFIVELTDPQLATIMFGHLPHVKLGRTTTEKQIRANVGFQELFSIPTDELKQAWKEPMKGVFH